MNSIVSGQSIWRSAETLAARGGGKRVLIMGCAPLPFENARMNYAPGTRTWQFAQPLAQAGHAVCVVCTRIPGAYKEEVSEVRELARDGVVIYTLDPQSFESDEVIPGLMEVFRPEILVGASALPSRRAAELASDQPLWVDLFGDPMAEAQAKAAVLEQDDNMAYFYLMWSLLERGDAFSAVSERQRWAVIGQLGLFGRLNRKTHGLELVHTLPCALSDDQPSDNQNEDIEVSLEDVRDEDFVILWSGGFNTWCDVETLFQALESAMKEDASLLFVSTGGPVEGHDEGSYQRFVDLVSDSDLKHRFLLKGRLPAIEARRYLDRADLGLVTERAIYERALGSSARMVHWLARGLPFICALVSELSETLVEEELGWTYPPGDAEALARMILERVTERDRLAPRAALGRSYAGEHWSLQRTVAPLLAWVADARRLPDAGDARIRPFMETHMALAEARIEDLEERLESSESKYHALRHEVGTIHQSRFWQLWMTYFDVRRAVLRPFDLFRKKPRGE